METDGRTDTTDRINFPANAVGSDHRHRIDKYLDTLLANQPISDGEATDRCQKAAPQDGGLPELIVARSCLTNHSEAAARKDGWLGRLGLVEAVDAYVANTQNGGKPRMPMPVAQFRSSVNYMYANGKRVPDVPKPPTGKAEPVTLQKPVPVPRTGIVKRCFICSSPHHLANMCPQRRGSQAEIAAIV